MTLIEDARRLLMIGYDEPIGAGVPHPDYLICRGPATYHAEDCPWGRRERIVQALEAAQAVVDNMDSIGATGHGQWAISTSTEAGKRFVAAFKGDGE